jgi:hypothetical protein
MHGSGESDSLCGGKTVRGIPMLSNGRGLGGRNVSSRQRKNEPVAGSPQARSCAQIKH